MIKALYEVIAHCIVGVIDKNNGRPALSNQRGIGVVAFRQHEPGECQYAGCSQQDGEQVPLYGAALPGVDMDVAVGQLSGHGLLS